MTGISDFRQLIREAMQWARTWDDSEPLENLDEAVDYFLQAHGLPLGDGDSEANQ